jgi:hypothetical protein
MDKKEKSGYNVEDYGIAMADEEYLNLLCKYERWLEKTVWV